MTNDEHPQHSLDEFDLSLSDAFHLSSVELAGYLEGFCSPQEKARIDAHVVSCVRCTDEIADAREFLQAKFEGR